MMSMMENDEFNITPAMRQRYIERRRADIEALEAALARDDRQTLAFIAHQIAGNAAMFGYSDLEEFARRLENAVRNSDLAGLRPAVRSIRLWVDAQIAGINQSRPQTSTSDESRILL